MSVVVKQAPVGSLEFLRILEECFPEQTRLKPFAPKPEITSIISGHDFQLYGAGYWTVKGAVRDIEAGCEFNLDSSFGWVNGAVYTILLAIGSVIPALISLLYHHVTPQKYAELTIAQKQSVDFWCSYPMFFAIWAVPPLLYVAYLLIQFQSTDSSLLKKASQRLASQFPGTGGSRFGQPMPDQALWLGNLTKTEFLQELQQELAADPKAVTLRHNWKATSRNENEISLASGIGKRALVYSIRFVQYEEKNLVDVRPLGRLNISTKQAIGAGCVLSLLCLVPYLLAGEVGAAQLSILSLPLFGGAVSYVLKVRDEAVDKWVDELIYRALRKQSTVPTALPQSPTSTPEGWFEK